MHARPRGSQLPRSKLWRGHQHRPRLRAQPSVARVPSRPAGVPEAPSGQRPAAEDVRERTAGGAQVRAVHARARPARFSRPDPDGSTGHHARACTPRNGVRAKTRHRPPISRVQASGNRVRRETPQPTAEVAPLNPRAMTNQRPSCRALSHWGTRSHPPDRAETPAYTCDEAGVTRSREPDPPAVVGSRKDLRRRRLLRPVGQPGHHIGAHPVKIAVGLWPSATGLHGTPPRARAGLLSGVRGDLAHLDLLERHRVRANDVPFMWLGGRSCPGAEQ